MLYAIVWSAYSTNTATEHKALWAIALKETWTVIATLTGAGLHLPAPFPCLNTAEV